MKKFLILLVVFTLFLLTPTIISAKSTAYTTADGWPEKDITVIIPWNAGGSTDITCRGMASFLEKKFPVNFVIMNTSGGGGAVGWNALIASNPDGYTMSASTTSHVIGPYLGTATHSVLDANTIALFAAAPSCIAVPIDSPYQTLEDLITYAKKNPEVLMVSNSGVGGTWHAVMLTLEHNMDVKFTHIPYESGTAAATAAAGGHVDAVCSGAGEAASLVAAGKLRYLGISTEERMETAPDVPTFKELGMDFMWGSHIGLAVPLKTPTEVVDLLVKAMKEVVTSDEWVTFMNNVGYTMIWDSGETLKDKLETMDATFTAIYTKTN